MHVYRNKKLQENIRKKNQKNLEAKAKIKEMEEAQEDRKIQEYKVLKRKKSDLMRKKIKENFYKERMKVKLKTKLEKEKLL